MDDRCGAEAGVYGDGDGAEFGGFFFGAMREGVKGWGWGASAWRRFRFRCCVR